MSTRILILTAGFGEGHNAAARNLEAAFNTSAGPDTARTADLFALASPRLNALSRRGYLALINGAPKLWSAFYAWIDRSHILPRGLWFFRREMRVLEELIAREKPEAICSTYPVYGFMMEYLVRKGRVPAIPHFNVVTDSISINSLWWRPKCEGWFVPNEDSAEVLRRAGIGAELIHTLGFPTPAFILENSQLSPPKLTGTAPGRDAHDHAPRVLYIINSGTRGAETTARLLLAERDWEVTCAVGRDERLRRHLERLAEGRSRPATILGWTDQIPRLLLTHHLVISKAGGATTQEAIAARCPMIVNQIVPGQEEGNYELLRRHNVGALAETPDAVISACRRAFAWGGIAWRDWRDSLSTFARPDAANAIAEHVLQHLDANKVAVDLRATAVSIPPVATIPAARSSAATL
jgi:processive 1,2-diacylglycerol beta-glucosyltransferase